jgi:hypothetical protein
MYRSSMMCRCVSHSQVCSFLALPEEPGSHAVNLFAAISWCNCANRLFAVLYGYQSAKGKNAKKLAKRSLLFLPLIRGADLASV